MNTVFASLLRALLVTAAFSLAAATPNHLLLPSLGRPISAADGNIDCDASQPGKYSCPSSTTCCCSKLDAIATSCVAYACCSDGSQVCSDTAAASGCTPAPKACESDFWLFQLEQLAGPDVHSNMSFWREWLQELDVYRTRLHQSISYSDMLYARVPWTQYNFVSPQMHPFELSFYNPDHGYTPETWLDGVTQRYGGIDSVLLWVTYPNIGIDNRNQFDWHQSVPGGLAALRDVVSRLHARGVKVLLPYNPWDTGSSRVLMRNASGDAEAMQQLLEETGADGYNGDTMVSMGADLYAATQAVLEPECGGAVSSLNYTFNGWAYWENQRAQPCVDRWHWLENKRITHVCDRWSKDKTIDLQSAVFNGVGHALSWENVWGTWNGVTARGSAQIARVSAVQRYFQPLMVSADFQPFYPTLATNVFSTRWLTPSGDQLFIIINRSGKDWPVLPLLNVSSDAGSVVIDCYLGHILVNSTATSDVTIAVAAEALGFACVWVGNSSRAPSSDFLASMSSLTAISLADIDNTWAAQHTVSPPHRFTRILATPPPGMVFVPGGEFNFTTKGAEIEGPDNYGVDFQFPWETDAQRAHSTVLRMPPLYVDEFPVTNTQWSDYIKASSYKPTDDNFYLSWWGRPGFNISGDDGYRPVTWVSPQEAAGYCAFYEKRLPHAWEWQYAASGPSHNSTYPWGDAPPSTDYVPAQNSDTDPPPPDRVDAHPRGKSVFGISDAVGNIWQFTDTYSDGHTRSQLLKGGSYYRPQGSEWYFPHSIELQSHNKYLLFDGGYNRAATVGFRCVADASYMQATPA